MRYLEGPRGSVRFRYDPAKITLDELVRAVEKANPAYRVAVGKPEDVPPAAGDIDFRIISAGGRYDLEGNLAEGKITLVHFEKTDDMRFAMELDRIALKHGCAIRKVHVGEETARKQFEADFGTKPLPYVRVYGRNGALVGEAYTIDEAEKILRHP